MSGYGLNFEGHTFTPDGDTPRAEPATETERRNRETSAAEVAAFKARTADRWFGYVADCNRPIRRADGHLLYHVLCRGSRIVTWTGETLAEVESAGLTYECPAFRGRSTRQNFRARGIDGRTWSGTYYLSSGDYVRMRAVRD